MNRDDLQSMRDNYDTQGIGDGEINPNPMSQFENWFETVKTTTAGEEPNVFVLSTIDQNGFPSSRVLLLKGFQPNIGFVFYTNYQSDKAKEIEINNQASMLFFWQNHHRQVRIWGKIEKVDQSLSDQYFSTRPRESQIGAWSSPQSKKISSRKVLDQLVTDTESKFKDYNTIPRPPHWGGYILKPTKMDFWQGRASRLHDRFLYELIDGSWIISRVAP